MYGRRVEAEILGPQTDRQTYIPAFLLSHFPSLPAYLPTYPHACIQTDR